LEEHPEHRESIKHIVTIPEFDYAEASDVLRHPDGSVVGTHPARERFAGGIIVHLDGNEHQERRRLLSEPFVKESEMLRLERDLIEPAVRASFDRLTRSEVTGSPIRAELMILMENIYWQLASAIVGLDGVTTETSAEILRETVHPVMEGVHIDSLMGDQSDALKRANLARESFCREYFDPSLERRRELLQRAASGRVDAKSVPSDAIVSMLKARLGRELILNEVTNLLVAATSNNSNAIAQCLIDLQEWFVRYPKDEGRRFDRAFLSLAMEETIRLRGSTHLRVRRFAVDGKLRSSGRDFSAGEQLVIDTARANRDPEVFGGNADEFDPYRCAEAGSPVRPYGLSFGDGKHMCLGRRLALGDRRTGRAGILIPVISGFYEAGIAFDPVRDVGVSPVDSRRYERFDVEFRNL
jgi:cytochrome P450